MIAFEVRDEAAAADLIEALRGVPPASERDERRRRRLADALEEALFRGLISKRARS